MRKNNQGSALVWALALMLMIITLLACILPLASSAILSSEDTNNKQQAYYTAKSVADMISEYLVSDVEKDPGKTILSKAMAADPDNGVSWNVSGLQDGMGDCQVNLRYKDGTLYVKATATQGDETRTVTVLLKKSSTGGSIQTGEEFATGYNGIRANQIYALSTADKTTNGAVIKMSETNVLVLNETEGNQDAIELDPNKLTAKTDHSSLLVERTDPGAAKGQRMGSVVYSSSDIICETPIVSNNLGSIVTKGNLALLSEKNLIHFVPNFICQIDPLKGNVYGSYSCKTLKLVGQIDFAQGSNNSNITAKNIIFSGRLVNKSSAIPAGITSSGYTFYVKDVCSLDYAHIIGKENQGAIFCNGPIYITTEKGGVTVEGPTEANSSYGGISGTYCNMKSSKNNKIYISGNIQCYQDDKKLKELDQYIADEKEKDSTFDATPYEDKKKLYTGDVVIEGGNKDTMTIHGNVLSRGTVTLKGRTKIDGYVAANKIVIEGKDVSVEGGCYPFQTFSYGKNSNHTTVVDKDEYAAANTGVNKKNGLGMFVYNLASDQYDFTPYAKLSVYADKNRCDMGPKVESAKKGNETITYTENVNHAIDEAQTKQPKVIKTIPSITKVDPANPITSFELRDSGNAYKAYEYTADCNLGKINVNSYGDVYLIVGEGVNLSVDQITSETMTGNIVFIVKKGGTLRLNQVNNTAGTTIKASVFTEDKGTVIVGNNTNLMGTIDVDQLKLGTGISYTKGGISGLTGGASKKASRWKIVQYTDGE